ncbi:hypothetical protein CWO89_22530 [Bradyrhizobium sp. Leo170]|nr:hypothetical protein CWO89_22530 [Bradyrhizobium sp. Leo170]
MTFFYTSQGRHEYRSKRLFLLAKLALSPAKFSALWVIDCEAADFHFDSPKSLICHLVLMERCYERTDLMGEGRAILVMFACRVFIDPMNERMEGCSLSRACAPRMI